MYRGNWTVGQSPGKNKSGRLRVGRSDRGMYIIGGFLLMYTKYMKLYASCDVQGKVATTEEALNCQVKMIHAMETR